MRCEYRLAGGRAANFVYATAAAPATIAMVRKRNLRRDIEAEIILSGVRKLGIDYGARRIGLALSDATGLLARPWKTIAGGRDAARRLADLARELRDEGDGLAAIVIGLPRRLSGEATDQTAAAIRLADDLRELVDVPIAMQDERLTSHEADELLARREKNWRKRKTLLDATAAAVILQDYLDEQRDRGDR